MAEAELVPAALPPEEARKKGRSEVEALLPELTPYVDPTAPDLAPLTNDRDSDLHRKLSAGEKQHFLDAYQSSGGVLSVACKAVSITPHTMRFHLQRDPNWLRHLKLLKFTLGEAVLAKSYERALTDNGVVDRMFQMQKRFFPHVYGDKSVKVAVGVHIDFGP